MGFGIGRAFKKTFGKVINKVTGGNAMLNKVIGLGLAPVTGGASLSVTNHATRMEEAHEARKEAAKEAAQEAVAQKEAADKFLTAALNSKGSSGFYETIESFKDNSDLPYTSVFDTSKWGGSGPILKAIKQY